MTDLECFDKTQKIKWIKKALNTNQEPWSHNDL
jgi:hypothetical protein